MNQVCICDEKIHVYCGGDIIHLESNDKDDKHIKSRVNKLPYEDYVISRKIYAINREVIDDCLKDID